MNPGAFWREAYLVAFKARADVATASAAAGVTLGRFIDPLGGAANDADAALKAYRSRFTVAGQLIDAEAEQ